MFSLELLTIYSKNRKQWGKAVPNTSYTTYFVIDLIR